MRSPAPSAMRTAAWASARSPPPGAACARGASHEHGNPVGAERHVIGRIQGVLTEKNPPQVVIVAHGVGYEIDVPMSTFYHLPRTGENVELLTHLVVREDAHLLFGFLTAGERSAFRQLLKVSGV